MRIFYKYIYSLFHIGKKWTMSSKYTKWQEKHNNGRLKLYMFKKLFWIWVNQKLQNGMIKIGVYNKCPEFFLHLKCTLDIYNFVKIKIYIYNAQINESRNVSDSA